MAEILLISSNTCKEPYQVYPLGVGVVRNILEKNGHRTQIYDFLAQQDKAISSVIDNCNPDYIAFSIRNIDNVDSCSGEEYWFLQKAKELIAQIKQSTSCPVIVGGSGFSLMPQEILDFIQADYGVIGEGEQSLPWLLQQLQQGEDIPRLIDSSRMFGRVAGSDIQGAKPDDLLARYYQQASGVLNIQSKRGCNYRCSYCPYPYLEPGSPRKRDIDQVVQEIKELADTYNPKQIFFVDSVFNDPEGHHLLLAEELLRQNVNISWSAFFHPSKTDYEQLKLLKRSGLQGIELGTDASTDETLRGINKSFDMDTVFDFQEKCVRLQIPCAHFVIFGGPGEDMTTVHQGIKNLNNLSKCMVFAFSGIRILKNTPLYKQAIEEGVIDSDQSLLRPHFYFSKEINPQEMNKELEQGFAGRKDRIFPPSKGMERMEVLHQFGYKGILWDKLIRF